MPWKPFSGWPKTSRGTASAWYVRDPFRDLPPDVRAGELSPDDLCPICHRWPLKVVYDSLEAPGTPWIRYVMFHAREAHQRVREAARPIPARPEVPRRDWQAERDAAEGDGWGLTPPTLTLLPPEQP